MARTGIYGHVADGRQPVDRAAAEGYDACIVSENIARLYRSAGYDAVALPRPFKAQPRDGASFVVVERAGALAVHAATD
jgi:uncharacterized protein YkwD